MKHKVRGNLQLKLIFSFLLIMTVAGTLSFIIICLLYWMRFSPMVQMPTEAMIIVALITSVLIGFTVSIFVSMRVLSPIRQTIAATREIAKGNYDVRIDNSELSGELLELVDSFNAMAEDLGGLEMFRNDFIDTFSHEFKTPIVSIRGFARQLQKGDLTPEQQREYIDIIAKEADHLVTMSSNTLLLSRLENQQLPDAATTFSLDEQIRLCILMLEKQWTAKQQEIIPELDNVQITANENLLKHVWINLLSNAVKFTEAGGTIAVTCVKDKHMVSVTVSDSGIGMDEHTLRHIFDKFYQGDTSHKADGNGLGLPLVKRIVELTGGTVSVSSEHGKGTTFTVALPRSE